MMEERDGLSYFADQESESFGPSPHASPLLGMSGEHLPGVPSRPYETVHPTFLRRERWWKKGWKRRSLVVQDDPTSGLPVALAVQRVSSSPSSPPSPCESSTSTRSIIRLVDVQRVTKTYVPPEESIPAPLPCGREEYRFGQIGFCIVTAREKYVFASGSMEGADAWVQWLLSLAGHMKNLAGGACSRAVSPIPPLSPQGSFDLSRQQRFPVLSLNPDFRSIGSSSFTGSPQSSPKLSGASPRKVESVSSSPEHVSLCSSGKGGRCTLASPPLTLYDALARDSSCSLARSAPRQVHLAPAISAPQSLLAASPSPSPRGSPTLADLL